MTALPRRLFTSVLPGLRRPLREPEGIILNKYLDLLTKWQKTHRLIGSTDPEWMVDNVVLDSFAFLALVPDRAHRLIDLGSGAGIPGVPIAIVRPDLDITLVEVRRRRVSFLATVVRELELTHIRVIGDRIEAVARELPGGWDVVTMRSVGSSDTMLATARALVRPDGVVLLASSPGATATDDTEVVDIPGRGPRHFRILRGAQRDNRS